MTVELDPALLFLYTSWTRKGTKTRRSNTITITEEQDLASADFQ